MAEKRPCYLLSDCKRPFSFDFKRFFMPDSDCKTRGNRQKLKIPKLSNSAARTNFFAVRIVSIWNSLTDEIILWGNY